MNTWFPKQIIIVIAAICLTIFALIYPEAAYAADITVSAAEDQLDGNPGASNGCSLREAIDNANNDGTPAPQGDCAAGNGADVILVPSGVYTLTIDGARIEDGNATGDLDILDDLTIVGASPFLSIIQAGTYSIPLCGDCIDRVFHIGESVSVTMTKVTIRHGKAEDATPSLPALPGGGIRNQGSLTLNTVIVTLNHAGIGVPDTSGYGRPGGNGGGIQNLGTLTAINSRITHNHAGDGGDGENSGYAGFGGWGGGIYAGFEDVITLINTTIRENSAGDGGRGGDDPIEDGGDGGEGGRGGGISCGNCSLSMLNSYMISNTSGHGGDGGDTTDLGNMNRNGGFGGWGGEGGGLYLNGSNAIASLTASWVAENEASNGGGGGLAGGNGNDGPGGVRGSGGGIYAEGDAQLSIAGCTISDNNAYNGGGIASLDGSDVVLYNSTISGNTAAFGNGGGIYGDDEGTTMDLSFSTITNNFLSIYGDGGGFWHYGTLTMTNNIVAGNHSDPSMNEDCRGDPISLGYNIFGIKWSGCFVFTSPDLTDNSGNKSTPLDAQLSPLSDNGGPTRTHALAVTSPAFNQIPNGVNGCSIGTTKDQRGVYRINTCDIGAYELVYFIYLPLIMR